LLLLASGGLRPVLVREGVQRPGDLDRILGTHCVLASGAALLLCVLLTGVAGVLPLPGSERTLLILMGAGNVAASLNLLSLFDVHHRQTRCAVAALVAEVLGLLAVVGLVRAGELNPAAVGAVIAGKWLLTTALQFAIYHFTVRRVRIVISWEDVSRTLRSSLPVLVSSLLASLPFSSGAFFLRAFGNDADVALFGLCYQLVVVYATFALLGAQVLQPHVAGPWGLHRSFVWKLALFYGGFLTLLWAAALGGALLILFGLLDPFYRRAALPLALYLCGAWLFAVSYLANAYLLRFRRERVLLVASLVSGAAYVVGCLVFVPLYSVTGAAAVLVGAALLQAALVLRAVAVGFADAAVMVPDLPAAAPSFPTPSAPRADSAPAPGPADTPAAPPGACPAPAAGSPGSPAPPPD
jgi:O-antigen/teichoic acid export membrane protein